MRWLLSTERISVFGFPVSGPVWIVEAMAPETGITDVSAVIMAEPIQEPYGVESGFHALAHAISYSELSPFQRWEYLRWLASGRNQPIENEYLKLWLYGLERICLIEGRLISLDSNTLDDLISVLEQERNHRKRPPEFKDRLSRLQALIDPAFAQSRGLNYELDETANRIRSGAPLSPRDIWCGLRAIGHEWTQSTFAGPKVYDRLAEAIEQFGAFGMNPAELETLPARDVAYTPISPALAPLGTFTTRIKGTVNLLKSEPFVTYLNEIAAIASGPANPIEIREPHKASTPPAAPALEKDAALRASARAWIPTRGKLPKAEARYLAHLNKSATLTKREIRAIEEELCHAVFDLAEQPEKVTPLLDLLTLISADKLSSDCLSLRPLANMVLHHEPTLLRVMQHYADTGRGLQDNIFAELACRKSARDPRCTDLAHDTAKLLFAREYRRHAPVMAVLQVDSVLVPFRYVPVGNGPDLPRSVNVFFRASAGIFTDDSFNTLYEACIPEIVGPARAMKKPAAKPAPGTHHQQRAQPTVRSSTTAPANTVLRPAPAVVDKDATWVGLGDDFALKGRRFACWLMYVRKNPVPNDPLFAVSIEQDVRSDSLNLERETTFVERYEHLPYLDQVRFLFWITSGRCDAQFIKCFTMIHFRGLEARYFTHIRRDAPLEAPELRAIETRVMDMLLPFSEDTEFATPLLDFLTLTSADKLSTDPLCSVPLANLFLFHEPTLLRVLTKTAECDTTLDPLLVGEWAARQIHDEPFFHGKEPTVIKRSLAKCYETGIARKWKLYPTYGLVPFRYWSLSQSDLVPKAVDVFLKVTAEDLEVGNVQELIELCRDDLTIASVEERPFPFSYLHDNSYKREPKRTKPTTETKARPAKQQPGRKSAESILKAAVNAASGSIKTIKTAPAPRARATKEKKQVTVSSPSPASAPARRKRLDWAKVAVIQSDSVVSQRYLDTILSEDDSVEIPVPATAPPPAAGLWSLETLLRALIGQPRWPRAELEALAKSHGIMLDGALSDLNEQAFDQLDTALLYGDDPVEVDLDVAAQLLPRMDM